MHICVNFISFIRFVSVCVSIRMTQMCSKLYLRQM